MPSAYLWSLVLSRGLVLPAVPWAVWALPGTVWQLSPAAFLLLLAGVTFATAAMARRVDGRSIRAAGATVLVLLCVIHVVWGWAVVAAR